MDSDSVIMSIDQCLRTSPGLRADAACRRELLRICEGNLHLTGRQLFDAFRGHLDMVTLQILVSSWDTWRVLSMRRTRRRTITDLVIARSGACRRQVSRRMRRDRSAAILATEDAVAVAAR
jgi:hypothetical protein